MATPNDGADSTPRTPIQKSFQQLQKTVRGIANTSNFFLDNRFWAATAIGIGIVPLLLSLALGIIGHQILSAILLSLLCIGLLWKDGWIRCIIAITLTFLSHSALAVIFAQHYPDLCAEIMPKAADYWEQQRHWITTGENIEYELSTWVPAHITLFFGTTFYSFCSCNGLHFRDDGIRPVNKTLYLVS